MTAIPADAAAPPIPGCEPGMDPGCVFDCRWRIQARDHVRLDEPAGLIPNLQYTPGRMMGKRAANEYLGVVTRRDPGFKAVTSPFGRRVDEIHRSIAAQVCFSDCHPG